MQNLRPYQQSALDSLRQGIASKHLAQLLMLPTGAGKTTVASAMFQGAMKKGKRVLFIVDTIELIDQTVRRFTEDGMEIGVIQGQHEMTDYSKPVQIATIQTLRNRWEQMAQWMAFDLVVIDEAHVIHSQHRDIIEHCLENRIPVIGLSATPFRKGMGKIFDSMVVGTSVTDLTDNGYLVPATCYAPHIPNLKGVKTTSDGDWQEDALAEYMGQAAIVGGVVEKWLQIGEDRQTLVFGANRAHANLLCAEFKERGVVADYVDGRTDKEEREAIIQAYRDGRIKVLCNVGVLTKGFDAPETSCVVIARPTKSLMMHIQIIGRGLRPAPGKQDCIVIDHAGNCIRNGLPTEPLPTELHDGAVGSTNPDRRQREEKEREPKECPSCGALKSAHVCPKCGFKPEVREDVESRDGDLVEIGSGKKKEWTPAKKAEFYAELLGYAQVKGYRPGWAYMKCREFVGSTPRNTREIPAKHPSDATMRIIQHLNIRAAKRRASA